MSWLLNFYRSAVGKKIVMAVTGLALFGFVVGHLVGNLKLYFGAEKLDAYGVWLRELGGAALPHETLLWIARIGLLIAVILHIDAAVRLTLMNRAARPDGYSFRNNVAASYASRTMRWGGVLILLFIIYHLLDLTFGTVNPGFEHGRIYRNVVASFSNPWVSLFYIVANLALGLHLYHGLWSMFQSLGLNNPRFNHWRQAFASAFAILITAGNLSFPISVMLGWVR